VNSIDYVIEFTDGDRWYLTTRKDADVSIIWQSPYKDMIRAIYTMDVRTGRLVKV